MTNKELQEALAKLPPDAPIRVWIEGTWAELVDVGRTPYKPNYMIFIDLFGGDK